MGFLEVVINLIFCFSILSYERFFFNDLVNHTRIINKNYRIKQLLDGNSKLMMLYKGKDPLDRIKVFTYNSLTCYLIGEQGYYIIKRITGKMVIYNDHNELSGKQKKVFNKLYKQYEF